MHKDYYCAYHSAQVITTFCRCPECLLPACATCMRLHSEEHELNRSQPQYHSIKEVIQEVDEELNSLAVRIRGLQEFLVSREKSRKDEMLRLKQEISGRRRQVVGEFEAAIKELDRKIVEAIYEIDRDFILEIEGLDDQILAINQQVQAEKSALRSQQSLGSIISYLYDRKFLEYEDRIAAIEQEIQIFASKSISVTFDTAFKQKQTQILQQLISISEVAAT